VCLGNPDAKRLYDDLLSNYNKLVRPVVNVTDALTVRIKLKLSQLIDVVSFLFPIPRTKKNTGS
jgi:nicotinic acetylcholine receptor, invertebrate